MTPDIVVDIGNSRMKWGRCSDASVEEMVSLPLDSTAAWDKQSLGWGLHAPKRWAIASVNPPASERFTTHLRDCGHDVVIVSDYRTLPIEVAIREPASVGIDRLLNALAAQRRATPHAAIVISVGTAVTVDLVDEKNRFRGGVIFPGPELMAKSLHEHTARLPLVDLAKFEDALDRGLFPTYPRGESTQEAILFGIHEAILGAAMNSANLLADSVEGDFPRLFVTGGGSQTLANYTMEEVKVVDVPHLTLEGLRIAAEALP